MPDGVDGWPAAPPAGGPPLSRREILWIASLTMAVLIVVVILFVYDPDAALADSVARQRADVVERVEYEQGNFLDPSALTVYLKPGTSREQAVLFACNYLGPLVATRARLEYEIRGLSPWGCPVQ